MSRGLGAVQLLIGGIVACGRRETPSITAEPAADAAPDAAPNATREVEDPREKLIARIDRADHVECFGLEGDVLSWRTRTAAGGQLRMRASVSGGRVEPEPGSVARCDVLSDSPPVVRADDGQVLALDPGGTSRVLRSHSYGAVDRALFDGGAALVRDGLLYVGDIGHDGLLEVTIANGAHSRLAPAPRGLDEITVTRDLVVWTERTAAGAEINAGDVRAMPRRGGKSWSLRGLRDPASTWSLRATETQAFWIEGMPPPCRVLVATLTTLPPKVPTAPRPLEDTAGAVRIVAIEGGSLLWWNWDGAHETDVAHDRRVRDWSIPHEEKRTPEHSAFWIGLNRDWIVWLDDARSEIRARPRSH